MSLDTAIKHKQELIKTHRRRLYNLQLNAARHGVNAPAEIVMEIEDIEQKLETLERELQQLQGTTRPGDD